MTAARVMICSVFMLPLALAGARARADDPGGSCQSTGWDMRNEIAAFKSTAENVPAAATQVNLAPLEAGVLYVVKLRPQTEVHYLATADRKSLVHSPLGGLVALVVPTDGEYRITVDSPLWMDVVGPHGALAPSSYTGWHECRLFRKSIEYALTAADPWVLQISEATPELVRVVVEPARH
jgi:hypothetical protein